MAGEWFGERRRWVGVGSSHVKRGRAVERDEKTSVVGRELRAGEGKKRDYVARVDVINATGRPSPFIPLWIPSSTNIPCKPHHSTNTHIQIHTHTRTNTHTYCLIKIYSAVYTRPPRPSVYARPLMSRKLVRKNAQGASGTASSKNNFKINFLFLDTTAFIVSTAEK